MLNLNRAMILGNATRDPEMRYTPNGKAVAHFAVATNRRWTAQSGDTQEQVEFHEIVAWGKLAEITNQIIHKGQKVYVEGRLQTHSWEAPDGAKRQRTEIIAENIISLSPRGESASVSAPIDKEPKEDVDQTPPEEKAEPKQEKSKKADGKKKTPASEEKSDEINLDEIPF